MSEQWGVWLEDFGGWLCSPDGAPWTAQSPGVAGIVLIRARHDLFEQGKIKDRVLDGKFGALLDGSVIKKDTLCIRSFDEWAKNEGLIE